MKNKSEKLGKKDEKKASDSDVSKSKKSEPEDDVFTKEDFEDALKRVSRPICEPDEETT